VVNAFLYVYNYVPDSYKDKIVVMEVLGTYRQYNGFVDENVYVVKFLYSNDSSIVRGSIGNLEIFQDAANGSYRIHGFAPEGIVPHLIVGINSTIPVINNNTIIVYVSGDPMDKTALDNAWRQKVTVIG
jgi:hypothetical protein